MNDKWSRRFLDLAATVAAWTHDLSTKVGAVIVDGKKRVLSLGYNGFPRGIADTDARLNDRPTKYSLVVHAEANAILNATSSVEGAEIFVTHYPCGDCAKVIIQSGISSVNVYADTELTRWHDGNTLAKEMFIEAGVVVWVTDRSGNDG